MNEVLFEFSFYFLEPKQKKDIILSLLLHPILESNI